MNILNKLTIENLKVHKKQTITTIVAVSLACTLFFVIGFIVSSFLNQSIKETIANNSDYHFNINQFKYTDIEKVKQIKDLKSLKLFGQILTSKIDDETINVYKLDDNLFNEINIVNGKLPSNNGEVITTQMFLNNLDLHLNDTITISEYNKVYKIVGIFNQKGGFLGSKNPYNAFYTKENFNNDDYVSAIITLNHVDQNIIKQGDKINSIIEYEKDDMNKNIGGISYNADYLSYKGINTNYDLQLTTAIYTILTIVLLTIVGFICYFIIYNSFEISLNERKNMIGIFASLGATPRQISMSVFFESFIITIISIIVGFLFSYLLSFGLFSFVNIRLDGIISSKMDVSFNLTYMVYSLLFIIFTVFLASFSMTVRAKKISPIALIRNTETIKNKKLKTNHLFLKIFGIEGEYARKNMKRNKRKYHITVISMVISIILFVTFAGVMQYINSIIKKVNPYNNTDITISLPMDSNIINEIRKIKAIDSKFEYHMEILNSNNIKNYYSEDYKKEVLNHSVNQEQNGHKTFMAIVINDNDYKILIKSINLKGVDYFITGKYNLNNENMYIFNNNKIDSLNLCKDYLLYGQSSKTIDNNCEYKINNIPVINDGINLFAFQPAVYMNETYFESISNYAQKYDDDIKDQSILEKVNKLNKNKRLQIIIKSKNYKKFDKKIKEIFKTNGINFSQGSYDYYNPYMEMDNQINLINTIQIAVYIIIFYIMGIALLSVYNTVEASLELRKREFATLKSIGMDKKGFNKITIFESLILSLKAIIYAIPFIYIILIIIYKVFNLGQTINGEVEVVYSSVKPPYLMIGLSFVVISILVYLINRTISKKISTEKIINTIK